jgi:hypothetical protein
MNLTDILESSAMASIVGGIAYAVNKWLIPAYKGLKNEIEELRTKLDLEMELRIDLESQLSYLKGKYAEKTVLRSGKIKKKKKNE